MILCWSIASFDLRYFDHIGNVDDDESEDEETDDEMEAHSSARRKIGSHSCSSEDEVNAEENNDKNKSRGRIVSCVCPLTNYK